MPAKRKAAAVSASPSPKKSKGGNKVALVGGEGSLTHTAAVDYFSGNSWDFHGVTSFEEVFRSVEDGVCAYGLIPMENSNSGTLHSVNNLLAKHKLFIVGEHAHKDSLCLVGAKGAALKKAKRVYSHPTVLSNCSAFLTGLAKDNGCEEEFERVSSVNVCAACKVVAGKTDAVAVANKEAAALFGLAVLKDDIGDPNLTTRYVVVSKTRGATGTLDSRKHSLGLTVRNEPGSFFKMLSAFAFRNINVVKLESRPACEAMDMFPFTARHWEYVHFVDFEPSMDAKANEGLLRDLEEYCVSVRDFGCYSKWVRPQGDKDADSFSNALWA